MEGGGYVKKCTPYTCYGSESIGVVLVMEEVVEGLDRVQEEEEEVWRPVDLQSDAFSATPALRRIGEIYRLYRMARTMRMLDVIEDKEYLEHPEKELVVSACFKGGGAGINEVLKELKLSDARKALFAATPFEPLLRMGDVKGEGHICHMMLLREIKPSWESVRKKRMHFKVGDHTISYVLHDHWVQVVVGGGGGGGAILPKKMFKSKYILNSSFRPRVIDIPDEHVSVNDLSEIIMDYSKFGGLSDGDAVRVVLLFILCRVFLSKELKDMVCREWFILADDFEAWNSFPWGTFIFSHAYEILQTMFGKIKNIIKSGVTSKIKYTVLGFTLPFKIWIWEMMPELMIINSVRVDSSLPRMTRWRQTKKITWKQVVSVFNLVKDSTKTVRMRHNMIASEEEKSEDYYLSFLDFMTASSHSVPDAIRGFMKNEFLAFSVNESASSPIPPPSPRTSPDPPPRTSPDPPPRTSPPRVSLTVDNDYMGYEFDSYVRGSEQYIPPPMSTNDFTDNLSFEVTGEMDNLVEEINIPPQLEDGNPKQLGEEEKEKEEPQKVSSEEEEEMHLKDVKIEKEESEGDGEAEENEDYDIKQIDMLPKSFKSKRIRKPSQAVKSPYTECKPKKRNRKGGGRDVTADIVCRDYSDYKLHPYHIALWVNLLNEKWQPEDDWTIMSPNYFTLSRDLNTWISCAKGDHKDVRCRPWKDVDRVFIPINIPHSHWILGELSLQTMKVRVFDSGLRMCSLNKLVSDGTIGRFQEDLVGLLDGIDYWGSACVGRKNPKDLTFKNVEGLPQQSDILGDCGVFLCMYLEQLVSGIKICDVSDTESLGKEFRIRMGKIFYGSCNRVV
ncbi:hypothetical protein LXL04_026432 [Taraxacum kok-saghyz]